MNSAKHYTILTVSLTEETIAILAFGRWEIYTVADGMEMFSHYATPGEALQIVQACLGGVA